MCAYRNIKVPNKFYRQAGPKRAENLCPAIRSRGNIRCKRCLLIQYFPTTRKKHFLSIEREHCTFFLRVFLFFFIIIYTLATHNLLYVKEKTCCDDYISYGGGERGERRKRKKKKERKSAILSVSFQMAPYKHSKFTHL